MEALKEIVQSWKYSRDGWLKVMRMEHLGEKLILDFLVDDGVSGHSLQVWRIRCENTRGVRICPGLAHDLKMVQDHVLLWAHQQPETSLYVNGKADDHSCVVGVLFAKHKEVAQGWYPFGEVLHEPRLVLSLGFGLLARGPRPLMNAYGEVLQQYGFDVSTVDHSAPEDAERGGPRHKGDLSVLIAGNTYVVAHGFTAENVTPSETGCE